MPETVTQCPLCGGDRSRLFDRREFRGQAVTNYLCLECGLVYQSPRMTRAESTAYYEAEYRRTYQGDESPIAKDLAVQHARAGSLLGFAQAYVEKISQHLDIGCSSGLLLQEFHEDYGCQLIGVEPGEAYRAYARAQGLTVYASLDELKKKEARFDLVSLAHVLEHLPAPVAYLANLRTDLMTPGGWLLLEVPNLYAHDCFETAHLVSYSPRKLAETVEQAGFEIVKLEAHGRPRSELVPYYLTLLARAHSGTPRTVSLHPEKLVGFKRCFGLFRRRVLSRLFPKKTWIELS